MSRGVFHSTNKVGQIFSFQTNVTSGSTFDPSVTFLTGTDRVSWDLGNGKLIAGNSLNYTFTGDTGTTKTIKLKTNRVSKLKQFQFESDNIINNLNLSKFSNLGGNFYIYNNPKLTGITHSYSTQIFTQYLANDCGLTGNHDLSMFPNLGGYFSLYSNTGLTSITHAYSIKVFSYYDVSYCNLTGNHDLSMLPNLGGYFGVSNNKNLTGITHTESTRVFSNYSATNCNLGYINFKLFSGATFNNSAINLNDNLMSSVDVNHILDDFKTITVANPTKWVGITLTIGGTNQNPDSSSGGYNGLGAISTLTGSPYNWIISY